MTSFEYDPVGNRLLEAKDGQITAYTFNDDDQVVTAGTASYTYDERGNLATITDGSDVTNYDHDGRRIGQTVNSPIVDQVRGYLPNGYVFRWAGGCP